MLHFEIPGTWSIISQIMTKDKITKVIVIVGPTASGKSDLAVEIALRLSSGRAKKNIGAEIISADSRQVYRGMDIGTGKITKKEMRGVPHYLLDVASPKKEFNVAHFKKLAQKKIKEIISRGKIPVIVGGTGFWIDALVYDLNLPEVKPDKKLRAKLEVQSVEELFIKLKKLDPRRAKAIDSKNKRRLVRALEIILLTKKAIPQITSRLKYDALFIGIKISKDILYKRIYKRLIARLEKGMVQEIKKLHKSGVSWKRLDDFGLEYRYVSRYIRGQLNREQMIDETFRAIKKYAKRQMTWFKRNKEINWVDNPKEALVLFGSNL